MFKLALYSGALVIKLIKCSRKLFKSKNIAITLLASLLLNALLPLHVSVQNIIYKLTKIMYRVKTDMQQICDNSVDLPWVCHSSVTDIQQT